MAPLEAAALGPCWGVDICIIIWKGAELPANVHGTLLPCSVRHKITPRTVKRQDNTSFGAPVSTRAYSVITEALQKQTAYKQTKNSEEFVQIQLNRNPVLVKLRWK